MRKKCFWDPIYGKQLRMIAILVQMFFLYIGQVSAVFD